MCKKNIKYPYFFNYLILFDFPQEINIISFKAGAKERLQEEKKEKKKVISSVSQYHLTLFFKSLLYSVRYNIILNDRSWKFTIKRTKYSVHKLTAALQIRIERDKR